MKRKIKPRLRTPDWVRKAGPQRDRTKYSRKAKHKRGDQQCTD